MSNYSEHFYTAQDGLRLYFRIYGSSLYSGVPVLCLPGLTRNAKDFHPLALRLGSARQVICPDYRGRGKSEFDRHAANYQPRTYLEDIRHLLTIIGIHHVVIAGTSMGGLLAMGLGVTTPTTLAGVILNDIGPDISDGLRGILKYAGIDRPMPDWQSAANEFRRIHPNTEFQNDEDRRRAIRATWRERSDGMLHVDWDTRIIQPLLNGSPLPDLWKLFRSLRHIPVLALRGELSDILSHETLQRMTVEHPGMMTVEVKNTGHTPSLNEPESIDAIDSFFSKL